MSASQDKRKRNSPGSGFGTGGSKKGKDEKGKVSARAAIITVIVVAVLFVAALVINSDWLRQNTAAVKVDGIKYTITDFNYYYETVYAQYYNAMNGTGSFGQSMLPQQNVSLKTQIYDQETGQTWADFFKKMALEQIKSDNKTYKAALEAKYQLTADDKKKIDDNINTMKQNGIVNGTSDFNKYLKAVFGKGMTEAVYRKNLERSMMISSFTDYKRNSFEYSASDIEAYYTANKDSFDTYTYRYFLVSAADVKDTDYPDDASYQAAKGAAVAAAVEKAKGIAGTLSSEKAFIDAARAYDPETNKEDSTTQRVYQGNLLGSVYGPWMKDAARKTGDVSTFETTTGCYIVYYGTRSDNHYPTVNMLQLLVKPETVDKTQFEKETNDDAYNAAVAKAKTDAQTTINKINDEWVQAGATGDKLKELTTSHAKEISADDSKEMTNVYKTQLPKEVNDWLYDSSRKAGDHAVLYNETTGYYIVYFEGPGKQYSDVLADKDKRDKDLRAWQDSLQGSDPTTTWLIRLSV